MSLRCPYCCGSIIPTGRFVHVNDTSQWMLTCLSGPRCSYVLCTYLSSMEATILWGGLTSMSNLSRLSNEKKRFLLATINLILTENACHSSREGSLRIYCQFRWTLARQFVCLRLWCRYINYTLHLGLGVIFALETSPYLHLACYLSNRKSSPSSFRSEVDWNQESRGDNNGNPSPNQEQECSMPFQGINC